MDRSGGWNGPLVVDLKMSCHRGEGSGANCLAHGFIEQGCDDASVQIAGVTFKCNRNVCGTHHRTVGRQQKLELQAIWIGFAASEAAILSGV